MGKEAEEKKTRHTAFSERDDEAEFVERSQQLVTNLYQLFKISRIHELDNEALVEPFQKSEAAINKWLEEKGSLTLSVKDDELFLDRKIVKFGARTFGMLRDLVELLEKKEVGRITFAQTVSRELMSKFLTAFNSPRGGDKKQVQAIREAMAQAGVEGIRLSSLDDLDQESVRVTIQTDETSYARLAYAKALTLLRQYFLNINDPTKREALGPKIRRAVQDLVAAAAANGDRLLGLARGQVSDTYLLNHSVNVAVLAIVIGQTLDLNRAQLGELGLAAVYHDTGKLFLPPALLESKEEFSDEQRREMQQHPFLAADEFLRAKHISESTLARLVVAFEYNIRANGYPPAAADHELHLFSRIVAVCDVFDALTSNRPWREPHLADEALGIIREGAGERFDPVVVKAFVRRLGIYPLGTLVLLSNGERGVVIYNHAEAAKAARPLLKIALDREGKELTEEKLLDLSEDESVKVTRTEDAARYNINTTAFFS